MALQTLNIVSVVCVRGITLPERPAADPALGLCSFS